MHVNSDESSLIGVQHRARQLTSDERLLAGGDCVADGSTPAKPPWSEVIVFLAFLLRQSNIAVTKVHNKKEPTFKRGRPFFQFVIV